MNLQSSTTYSFRLIILFVLLGCSSSKNIHFSTGKSSWPYTEYQRADLYTFNETYPAENETNLPETSILVQEAINPKATFSSELEPYDIQNIVEILNQSSDLVAKGLSKCFIPRHGIVLYNSTDSIVGHLSLCFECDQIVAVPPIRYKKVSKENSVWKEKDIKKAEYDIESVEQIVLKYNQK